jgi:hypothetical protein
VRAIDVLVRDDYFVNGRNGLHNTRPSPGLCAHTHACLRPCLILMKVLVRFNTAVERRKRRH